MAYSTLLPDAVSHEDHRDIDYGLISPYHPDQTMPTLTQLVSLARNYHVRFADDVELLPQCSYIRIPEKTRDIVIFPPIEDLGFFNHITRAYRDTNLSDDNIIELLKEEGLAYIHDKILIEKERLTNITINTVYTVTEVASSSCYIYRLSNRVEQLRQVAISPIVEDSRLDEYLGYFLTSDIFVDRVKSMSVEQIIKTITEVIISYQLVC